jgi:branched-chain amino acid transport system substrate-binding protein
VKRGVILVIVAATIGFVAPALNARTSLQPLPQAFCSTVAGDPNARVLIASDFPLQGRRGANSAALNSAIRFILTRHHFRAGKYMVAFQQCDDSSPQTQSGDLTLCASNAKAYAADPSVGGIIGTWNSRCAAIEIPLLNAAPRGPLALVSPGNTGVGLTHAVPGTAPGEPQRYYPTGKRSFVRLIPSDDFQGVGDAVFAKDLRRRRVYVLDDGESYGIEVAASFTAAARRLHLGIVGRGSWNLDSTEFASVADGVRRARPDAVFLAGLTSDSTGVLLTELRGAIGAKGAIIASDGFSTLSDLIATFGRAATDGLYVSVPGLVRPKLGPVARTILKQFGTGRPGSGGPLDAAQAAEVLLAAIAHSDGSRASITRQLFKLRIKKSLLGTFQFDRNGDITLDTITVFQARGGRSSFARQLRFPHDLVK